MRVLIRKLVKSAIILLLLTDSWAQSSGKIKGVVTDPTGAVLPGASVSIANAATGMKLSTSSDAEGAYSFPVLPLGEYDIVVSASGFQESHPTHVVISINLAL